jgi:hypothetical protein
LYGDTKADLKFAPGGFCLVSGNTEAVFQTDGNFVTYRNNVAIWQSGTSSHYAQYELGVSTSNVHGLYVNASRSYPPNYNWFFVWRN